MKKLISILILLTGMFSCKENDEIRPACVFTFSGDTYRATTVKCEVNSMTISGDSFSLAIWLNSSYTISMATYDPFFLYYPPYGKLDIIRDGNAFTFDVEMETGDGKPAGRLNGSCKCKTGAL